MCQALPTAPAAEGHQVDQLEPTSLPTVERRKGESEGGEGRGESGKVVTDEENVGKAEGERERKVGVERCLPGHSG